MRKGMIFALSMVVLGVLVGTVYATEEQTKTTTTTTKSASEAAELKVKQKATSSDSASKAEVDKEKVEVKAADAVAKCDVIQAKIATINTRYEANKNHNVVAYQNMVERMTKFVARFQAKGLDTAKLTADISILDVKVAKLNADYLVYITALGNVKSYACGKSEGQFKAALEEARKQMQVVHADRADIQSFYQVTIRADLTALKSQVEKTEKAALSTPSTSTTGTSTDSTGSSPAAKSTTKEIR